MRYFAGLFAALSLFLAADVLAERGRSGDESAVPGHSHHGDSVEIDGVVTRGPDRSRTVIVSEHPILLEEGATIVREGGGAVQSPAELKSGCSVAVTGYKHGGLLVAEEVIIKEC